MTFFWINFEFSVPWYKFLFWICMVKQVIYDWNYECPLMCLICCWYLFLFCGCCLVFYFKKKTKNLIKRNKIVNNNYLYWVSVIDVTSNFSHFEIWTERDALIGLRCDAIINWVLFFPIFHQCRNLAGAHVASRRSFYLS